MDQRLIGGAQVKRTPVVLPKNIAQRKVAKIGRPVIRPRPVPKTLPNFNILKLMNGFVSFRSTIQELNQSLQQLVSIMDRSSKMYSAGRDTTGRGPFLPQLPSPPVNKPEFSDEDIPIIKLPNMPNLNSPLLRMFGNIDMNRMMGIIQSPIFQNILTRIFPVKQATTRARVTRPRKRNAIKRVKPS
jgi:hypothetical protein